MGLFVFKLPDLGEGAAEAEIVAWRVGEGDQIDEDAPLVDVMTDKATMEITSPVRGRVRSLKAAPGESAPVGAPIVEIETQDEEAEEFGEAVEQVRGEAPAAAAAASTAPAPERRAGPGSGGVLAAPAVRQRARELGIDLGTVRGSGPDGRITHADLDGAVGGRGAPRPAPRPAGEDPVEEIKVTGLRRRIAEKMQEAKRRIPHFGYVEETDVTELEALREQLNAAHGQARGRLTLLPFLIRAVVKAVAAHPEMNALYDDEAGVVRRHGAVHMGVAAQTPSGLMVPVIRHAEGRDLWGLAHEVARLAAAARDGKAERSELSGSTITITSLGKLGGLSHFPVINAPEVAILGPNRIIERPVVRHGQVVVRKIMNLSSAFDHRVIDGHDAAEFIQTIKRQLETPALLFVD